MKVCVVSKHYHPFAGGLESRVISLSEWLVGKGHEVVVLTAKERGTKRSEIINGVSVRRSTRLLNLFNAPIMPSIFSNLLNLEYDIIDVNLPDPVNSMFVFFASKLRKKPYVVTYHADIVKDAWYQLPFKLVYGLFLDLVLEDAGSILVTSPNYVELSSVLKRFQKKIVVAPSFVDMKKLSSSVDGSLVKGKFNIFGRKIVLFVGRLVPYKGLDYLIDAFSMLVNEFNAALIIVGEGPLEKRLKGKARKLKLSNVIFTGTVSDKDLPQYYAACDVFVLPSITRQEAFGLVLVEAMSCGKPVVSTNFSGMPYVVGDAGILVKPKDAIALKEALSKILSDDRLGSGLGVLGRMRVEELFNREVVCKRILDVYMEVSNRIKTKWT
ncbi:MAG: glycosyltransferase [Candidatus Altiarchaeota archaeon]|nr:glycosyltransferase [Candidatus Altiarchaeota archaeon]